MRKLLLGGLFALVAVPQAVFAGNFGSGVHFGLSGGKYDVSYNGDNFGDSKDQRTILDAKLGYLMDNSIYVGGIYSSFSQNTGTSSPSRTATGVTLGYHGDNGFFFDLNYYLMATYNSGGSSEFKNGSGFGADFGYNVMVSSNVYLGLQVSYRSVTYKKVSTGSTEVDRQNTVTDLYPLLNVGFYF